jgi:hypothetical protein
MECEHCVLVSECWAPAPEPNAANYQIEKEFLCEEHTFVCVSCDRRRKKLCVDFDPHWGADECLLGSICMKCRGLICLKCCPRIPHVSFPVCKKCVTESQNDKQKRVWQPKKKWVIKNI